MAGQLIAYGVSSVKHGKSRQVKFVSFATIVSLQASEFLSAHVGKIFTFPFVHKGAGLFHEPVFFRTPESVFEGFVAPLFR